ncbi:unnamed protein product [Vitrella brassicaformis CCMP3155]|uniref:Uncharacterized protein n=1 Tax=Vitrella brassicaformis (strain CCMP3155) TaxID=1169540 RepID=A0A0G4EUM3_VITBC|nr:unnamed protein product [Vitrella brassicaformis CCMP3155]|eukprot:CEM01931.1 unnamed protein product [Vitrella brassicaformis CCMP3155]
MDGPPAKASRTAPPAQSDDSSNRTASKSLTSLLDGLDLWLNVSSYQSVKERLAMSCVCRAFYWAIYSLIRVINWHRPNHGLSCRGPGGSLVTFEQQQHAIVLLPRDEEVEEIGRARLFAFVSLQLVNHTDTLKAIQTTQAKQQPDEDDNEDRDADGGEGSEDTASGLPVAQVKGPDAVFPSVRSVEVDSLDGLHLFQQQKLVCPALERLTAKVLSDKETSNLRREPSIYFPDPPSAVAKRASIRAVLDRSLAFIFGSSPALSHLDIFPLLCCDVYGRNESCVVPLTAAALPLLKKLRYVGHLKLQGHRNNTERTRVVSLLRQLTPHSGGGAAASSSSSASAAPSPSPWPSPSPSSSPSGAAKRQLKVNCPLRIVHDLVGDVPDLPLWSCGDSVQTIREAEKMGWEVVREGGTTCIQCRGETTEGPPAAETLEIVETIKRHAGGGDCVWLDSRSGDPTSPHFSGIQFDNASTLEITLRTAGPDVDAESFNCIPLWLTEETTLKSLSNVTTLCLTEVNSGSYGIPTCDPEYLIPLATPNRLSRLLSSLPALIQVELDYWPVHAIMASEALAYIQQGIAKPLKKLEIVHNEPLFFDRPRTKAAAPVAFPSPQTTRQYPRVQELNIEIKAIPINMVGSAEDIYNARAESVPMRLGDLFRLVHELRPKHATFKLSERADIFTAPGNADQVESELDLLFREGRVREDMAEYGMELRLPMLYRRYDGEDSSIEDLAAGPNEHELTVEMVIWPWDDSDDEEDMGLDDEEGWRD